MVRALNDIISKSHPPQSSTITGRWRSMDLVCLPKFNNALLLALPLAQLNWDYSNKVDHYMNWVPRDSSKGLKRKMIVSMLGSSIDPKHFSNLKVT